jgi:hypothetical protein
MNSDELCSHTSTSSLFLKTRLPTLEYSSADIPLQALPRSPRTAISIWLRHMRSPNSLPSSVPSEQASSLSGFLLQHCTTVAAPQRSSNCLSSDKNERHSISCLANETDAIRLHTNCNVVARGITPPICRSASAKSHVACSFAFEMML